MAHSVPSDHQGALTLDLVLGLDSEIHELDCAKCASLEYEGLDIVTGGANQVVGTGSGSEVASIRGPVCRRHVIGLEDLDTCNAQNNATSERTVAIVAVVTVDSILVLLDQQVIL